MADQRIGDEAEAWRSTALKAQETLREQTGGWARFVTELGQRAAGKEPS